MKKLLLILLIVGSGTLFANNFVNNIVLNPTEISGYSSQGGEATLTSGDGSIRNAYFLFSYMDKVPDYEGGYYFFETSSTEKQLVYTKYDLDDNKDIQIVLDYDASSKSYKNSNIEMKIIGKIAAFNLDPGSFMSSSPDSALKVIFTDLANSKTYERYYFDANMRTTYNQNSSIYSDSSLLYNDQTKCTSHGLHFDGTRCQELSSQHTAYIFSKRALENNKNISSAIPEGNNNIDLDSTTAYYPLAHNGSTSSFNEIVYFETNSDRTKLVVTTYSTVSTNGATKVFYTYDSATKTYIADSNSNFKIALLEYGSANSIDQVIFPEIGTNKMVKLLSIGPSVVEEMVYYNRDARAQFNTYYDINPNSISNDHICRHSGYVMNGSICEDPDFVYKPYNFLRPPLRILLQGAPGTSSTSSSADLKINFIPVEKPWKRIDGNVTVSLDGLIEKNIFVDVPTEYKKYYLEYTTQQDDCDIVPLGYAGENNNTAYTLSSAKVISSGTADFRIILRAGKRRIWSFSGIPEEAKKIKVVPISVDGTKSAFFDLTLPAQRLTDGTGSTATCVADGKYYISLFMYDENWHIIDNADVEKTPGVLEHNINSSSDRFNVDLSNSGSMTKGTISLSSGWNLVSLPAKNRLSIEEITAVFASSEIESVVKYETGSGWSYFWPQGKEQDLPFNRLLEIDYKDGFWVKANGATELKIRKGDTDNAVELKTLYSGWNLVGLTANKTVGDLKALISDQNKEFESIWVKRGNLWKKHLSTGASTLKDSDLLKQSEGIWIKIK